MLQIFSNVWSDVLCLSLRVYFMVVGSLKRWLNLYQTLGRHILEHVYVYVYFPLLFVFNNLFCCSDQPRVDTLCFSGAGEPAILLELLSL